MIVYLPVDFVLPFKFVLAYFQIPLRRVVQTQHQNIKVL